jgi:ferrous iron transport protein B
MADCHNGGVAAPPASVGKLRHYVALVGPPNAGKSTLFNQLTGLRVKTGNYPGVTVERRLGQARVDSTHAVQLIDLPGVYSLDPDSEDQRVTAEVLHGRMADMPAPDAVLLILDSTNLSRSLGLAAPILALRLPTLVILNMVDEMRDRGGEVDAARLQEQLGVPVVLTAATKGTGIDEVKRFLSTTNALQPVRIELPVIQDVPGCRKWAVQVGERSGYRAPAPPMWTRRLDKVLLHPVAGPLIFLFVMVLVFQCLFTWSVPLQDGIEQGISAAGRALQANLSESLWRSLLVDGLLGGVGAVVVFLPQILILFAFIGILEDSGYLARAALIADRTMAKVGLQGKSFIPLLSAYACAVPAVLATRTIENKRDRIATILIAPFMTCSARLPIYTLVITAFVPEQPLLGPFIGLRAFVMLLLYALGFAAAVFTAKILKSTILRSERSTFMLEMPPYRWPTLRTVLLRLYDRAKAFLLRAGTVILFASLLLWLLMALPLENGKPPAVEQSLAGRIGHAVEPLIAPLGFNWRTGVGILASLAAREMIVSTLGAIYGMEDASESDSRLQAAIQRDMSPAGGIALVIFFVFAMLCASTNAVVRRETGSWKWPVLQFAYMWGVAYVAAWAAYNIAGRYLQ